MLDTTKILDVLGTFILDSDSLNEIKTITPSDKIQSLRFLKKLEVILSENKLIAWNDWGFLDSVGFGIVLSYSLNLIRRCSFPFNPTSFDYLLFPVISWLTGLAVTGSLIFHHWRHRFQTWDGMVKINQIYLASLREMNKDQLVLWLQKEIIHHLSRHLDSKKLTSLNSYLVRSDRSRKKDQQIQKFIREVGKISIHYQKTVTDYSTLVWYSYIASFFTFIGAIYQCTFKPFTGNAYSPPDIIIATMLVVFFTCGRVYALKTPLSSALAVRWEIERLAELIDALEAESPRESREPIIKELQSGSPIKEVSLDSKVAQAKAQRKARQQAKKEAQNTCTTRVKRLIYYCGRNLSIYGFKMGYEMLLATQALFTREAKVLPHIQEEKKNQHSSKPKGALEFKKKTDRLLNLSTSKSQAIVKEEKASKKEQPSSKPEENKPEDYVSKTETQTFSKKEDELKLTLTENPNHEKEAPQVPEKLPGSDDKILTEINLVQLVEAKSAQSEIPKLKQNDQSEIPLEDKSPLKRDPLITLTLNHLQYFGGSFFEVRVRKSQMGRWLAFELTADEINDLQAKSLEQKSRKEQKIKEKLLAEQSKGTVDHLKRQGLIYTQSPPPPPPPTNTFMVTALK